MCLRDQNHCVKGCENPATFTITLLTFSHYGGRIDGPLPPALPRFLLGDDVQGGRLGVGQRHSDDGHRLVPRPVAVRVRADDLGPSDVGLILRGDSM